MDESPLFIYKSPLAYLKEERYQYRVNAYESAYFECPDVSVAM
jgi:hypothetical protein